MRHDLSLFSKIQIEKHMNNTNHECHGEKIFRTNREFLHAHASNDHVQQSPELSLNIPKVAKDGKDCPLPTTIP